MRLDELQRTVYVRRCLRVERDERRACIGEVADDAVNGGHHEVHVDGVRHAVVPEPLANQGADSEVRHVVVVHHVEVNDVRSRRHRVVHLLAQLRHVRREDRWCDPEVLLVVRVVGGHGNRGGRGPSQSGGPRGARDARHRRDESLPHPGARSGGHHHHRCLSHFWVGRVVVGGAGTRRG